MVALAPSVTPMNATIPVYLVDMQTGTSQVVSEQIATITSLEFSPTGAALAVGAEDGTSEVVTVSSRRPQMKLQSLPSLRAIAFSRDERFLAVGATGAISVYSARCNRQPTPQCRSRREQDVRPYHGLGSSSNWRLRIGLFPPRQ
jgi:WD40 repeat protein